MLHKPDLTLHSGHRGDNLGEEAAQPLVVGDGAVAVLVHLLEQTHLLLGCLEGGGESESKTGIITNCEARSGATDLFCAAVATLIMVPNSVSDTCPSLSASAACGKQSEELSELCGQLRPGNTSMRTSRSSCRTRNWCPRRSYSP